MTEVRNTKKKNIVIAIACCFMLLVGAISAYFYDAETEDITATISEVNVELSHPLGDAAIEDWASILPAQKLTMDPTVTNTGTEDAYVFMTVEVPKITSATHDEYGRVVDSAIVELFKYTISDKWYLLDTSTVAADYNKYFYVYGTETECTRLAPNTSTATLYRSNELTVANIQDDGTLVGTDYQIKYTVDAAQADWIGSKDPSKVRAKIKKNQN